MRTELRYIIQHIGDVIVERLEKTSLTARKCARGVVLTYDIHDLRRKKRHVLIDIGKRLTQATKEGLTDIKKDDTIIKLFSELDGIEKAIQAYEKERIEMISHSRSGISPAGNTS